MRKVSSIIAKLDKASAPRARSDASLSTHNICATSSSVKRISISSTRRPYAGDDGSKVVLHVPWGVGERSWNLPFRAATLVSHCGLQARKSGSFAGVRSLRTRSCLIPAGSSGKPGVAMAGGIAVGGLGNVGVQLHAESCGGVAVDRAQGATVGRALVLEDGGAGSSPT